MEMPDRLELDGVDNVFLLFELFAYELAKSVKQKTAGIMDEHRRLQA